LRQKYFQADEIVNLDNGLQWKSYDAIILEHQNHIEEQ
jgi:hypothetical protein